MSSSKKSAGEIDAEVRSDPIVNLRAARTRQEKEAEENEARLLSELEQIRKEQRRRIKISTELMSRTPGEIEFEPPQGMRKDAYLMRPRLLRGDDHRAQNEGEDPILRGEQDLERHPFLKEIITKPTKSVEMGKPVPANKSKAKRLPSVVDKSITRRFELIPKSVLLSQFPEQVHVFYHLAHVGQVPYSRRPAVRILGAFGSLEAGEEYFRGIDTGLPYVGHKEVGEWFIINAHKDAPESQLIEKMERMLLREKSINLKDEERFEEELRNHKRTPITEDGPEKKKEASRLNAPVNSSEVPLEFERPDGTVHKARPLPPYRQGNLVSGQNYAAVSFLLDYLNMECPEPMVAVHALFASEKQADHWIREHGLKLLPDFDIDLVEVGTWIFPEDVDSDEVEEIYRNPELQASHDYRKTHKKELAEFNDKCRKLGYMDSDDEEEEGEKSK